ncbi:MAG: universal stress protein [Flavobacteriales bacterium]|nr:universal stress protein [Flavobacteriales bacterium]
MSQLSYLVPHDFTSAADSATRHAIQIARQTKGIVHLLHVTKSDSEKAEANRKFAEVIPKLQLSIGDPKVETHVKTGSIFTDIGTMAKSLGCSLVVMGTHGAKGMQKVFGSFAIKVITSTEIPFVIVQDSTPVDNIKKIVAAIDLTSESLQVLNDAANLALDFNAELVILAPNETDAVLRKKISIYIDVIKKQMEKRNVNHLIEFIPKSKNATGILEYGKKAKADMYAIAYFSDSLLPQFDTFAQSMITNEQKVPCLIINSKEAGNAYF